MRVYIVWTVAIVGVAVTFGLAEWALQPLGYEKALRLFLFWPTSFSLIMTLVMACWLTVLYVRAGGWCYDKVSTFVVTPSPDK